MDMRTAKRDYMLAFTDLLLALEGAEALPNEVRDRLERFWDAQGESAGEMWMVCENCDHIARDHYHGAECASVEPCECTEFVADLSRDKVTGAWLERRRGEE